MFGHTHTHTHCAVSLGGLKMVSLCMTSLCETSIVPWEVPLKLIWADQMSLITFPLAREYCSLPVTTTSSNGEQNTCFRELNMFFSPHWSLTLADINQTRYFVSGSANTDVEKVISHEGLEGYDGVYFYVKSSFLDADAVSYEATLSALVFNMLLMKIACNGHHKLPHDRPYWPLCLLPPVCVCVCVCYDCAALMGCLWMMFWTISLTTVNEKHSLLQLHWSRKTSSFQQTDILKPFFTF